MTDREHSASSIYLDLVDGAPEADKILREGGIATGALIGGMVDKLVLYREDSMRRLADALARFSSKPVEQLIDEGWIRKHDLGWKDDVEWT